MRPYVPRSIRQLRRLLNGMPVGMLTTQSRGGATRSRPMVVRGVDESGWLWFLTDRQSRKVCELGQNPHATVAFQSKKGDRYVSIQGTAVVVREDVQIRELWNPTLRRWFPHDSETALIAVRVTRVEYWLVPRTRLARVIGRAKALLTGRQHRPGRHGILDLYPLVA